MIYSEKEKRVLTAFIYRPIMTNIIAFVMQIGLNNKINLQETSDIILEMENIDFVNSNYLLHDEDSSLLIGHLNEDDVIKERK